jgi:rifampin ADP-ribosylating transferase
VSDPLFPGRSFFHGTKANLKNGDLIGPGYTSNYGQRAMAAYVYLTGTLNAAIWGAELALGEGAGRIYVVEATGPVEDDPNLTDKKYPGNPTLSYRSKDPLRVIGEVIEWQGHPAEELKKMKDGVEQARQLGLEAIED